MNLEKQLEQFTNVDVISMERILASGGVIFYEVTSDENGEIKNIPHVAMPVVLKDFPTLNQLIDDMQAISNDLMSKMAKLEEDYRNEKITEEKYQKDMSLLNRKSLSKLTDIRLDIAVLCFKRVDKSTTKESLSLWMNNHMLNSIDSIAVGMSIPPKL